MNISYIKAENLEVGDWILRQITGYSFAQERITRIEYDEDYSRVYIHLGEDGYSINASSKHIFQKVS